MIPRMISHPIEPITVTYFTIMAASLGAGSVTALNFASDYQVLPVSLIGVAFSLAVFPTCRRRSPMATSRTFAPCSAATC